MSNDVELPGTGVATLTGAANVETLDQGGTGTTNATTSAGSTPGTNDTLHFASTPAFVALGMTAADTAGSGIGNIPAHARVIAFTGTTVQLSAFVTGTIGNGDTITFSAQRQVVKSWMNSSQLFSAGPQPANQSAPAVVQGQQATGSALSNNNPVLAGGSDGTNVRNILTDTSGRQEVVGAAAAGAAVAGNPVLVAGSDGTNAQDIATDTSGRVKVIGAAASGAAVAGNPVLVAGSDGTDARSISTDASGRVVTVGAAANGAAVAGNPTLIAGSDGTDARSIATSAAGNPLVAGDTAAAASDAGNPVKVGGVGHTANPTAVTDGQRANFITDKLGKQVVVGSIRDLKVTQTTANSTNGSVTCLAAQGASVFADIYGLIIANANANAVSVAISDGTKTYTWEVPATDTRGMMVPESAAVPATTANTAWTLQVTGTNSTGINATVLAVRTSSMTAEVVLDGGSSNVYRNPTAGTYANPTGLTSSVANGRIVLCTVNQNCPITAIARSDSGPAFSSIVSGRSNAFEDWTEMWSAPVGGSNLVAGTTFTVSVAQATAIVSTGCSAGGTSFIVGAITNPAGGAFTPASLVGLAVYDATKPGAVSGVTVSSVTGSNPYTINLSGPTTLAVSVNDGIAFGSGSASTSNYFSECMFVLSNGGNGVSIDQIATAGGLGSINTLPSLTTAQAGCLVVGHIRAGSTNNPVVSEFLGPNFDWLTGLCSGVTNFYMMVGYALDAFMATSNQTVAGSAVLNFSSVPAWVTNGLYVTDLSRSVVPAGTTVASSTGTTVTMSAACTGVGVFITDNIAFSTVPFTDVAGGVPSGVSGYPAMTASASDKEVANAVSFYPTPPAPPPSTGGATLSMMGV